MVLDSVIWNSGAERYYDNKTDKTYHLSRAITKSNGSISVPVSRHGILLGVEVIYVKGGIR